jgi:hypothetical protein
MRAKQAWLTFCTACEAPIEFQLWLVATRSGKFYLADPPARMVERFLVRVPCARCPGEVEVPLSPEPERLE